MIECLDDKKVTEQIQKDLAQLNQRAESSGKSEDIWLNKLRLVPYSGTVNGLVDPWIKLMETYSRGARQT